MTDDIALTRRTLLAAGAAAALAPNTRAAFGASPDVLKVIMEFRIYGGNAPMFLAQQSIFPKYDLDVTPIGSAGSGEAVRNVAAGVYKFGVADASTVIAFAGENPQVVPKIVMPIFDRVPACVISLKRKPAKSLTDLKTMKVGVGSSDAGAKLFQALLALNNMSFRSLDITTIDVKLRDALLMTGKVDAVIGFDYTSVFNLIGNGVRLEDIELLYFSDLGFSMFGNSVVTTQDVIDKEPDLVRRVVAAITESWIYGNSHREDAIKTVTAREKLLDPTVELARLSWVLDRLIMTPNVKANGLGTFAMSRLTDGIELIRKGFDFARAPAVDSVYDGRFIPPLKDRTFA
jgi:NitT/TauT family transport system substrate-binding protein